MAKKEKLSAAQQGMLDQLGHGSVITADPREKRTAQALKRRELVDYVERVDGTYVVRRPQSSDPLTPNKRRLVESVRAHANKPEHRNAGWDHVERMSDDEIRDLLGYTYTTTGAIKRVAEVIGAVH